MQHSGSTSNTLVARSPRRTARLWRAALLLPWLVACSGEGRSPELGSSAEALTDPYNPGHEFDGKAGTEGPSVASNDIVHYSDPALCSDEVATFLIVSTDSQHHYRTLFNDQEVRPSTWGSYGTKQFSSRPACAMRELGASGGHGFVLVGKGTDNVLYASPGSWDPHMHDGTPVNPTADTAWTAIDSTTYPTSGSPALATNAATNAMVVTYVNANGGNKVVVREHALPYEQQGSNWSAEIAAPALPAGWSGVGTPGITWEPNFNNLFQIVVHVKSGTQSRLLMTYFDPATRKFSGAIPGSPPGWKQLPIADTVDSDPALAYSPTLNTTTLYFRSGTQLKQTSGYGDFLGTNLVHVVGTTAGVTYPNGTGGTQAVSPSALSIPLENSNNIVIARISTNQLWASFSEQDAFLVP
ncbi:MAG TPA: hypothetical protein VMI54_00930 [Polyangiaceae bacterium]|nr:hypothetical protein [Polyangiaceae bacterium]